MCGSVNPFATFASIDFLHAFVDFSNEFSVGVSMIVSSLVFCYLNLPAISLTIHLHLLPSFIFSFFFCYNSSMYLLVCGEC